MRPPGCVGGQSPCRPAGGRPAGAAGPAAAGAGPVSAMMRPSSMPMLPAHPGGDGLVVGDHDDRGPGGVQLVQQVQDRLRRWRSRGCRWARRPARSPARPAIARAIATRCRSPPDSWVGRAASLWPSPTRASAPAASSRRSAGRVPGVQQPVGDVGQRGLVLGQEELLEHEPDRGRPQPGQLPVAQPGHVQPGHPHRPGWSAGPGSRPGAAAWSCPTPTARPPPPVPRPPRPAHPGQRASPAASPGRSWTPGPAPAPGPARRRRALRRPACARRGAHSAGTTTCCPAASPDPVTCTSPAASSNTPALTGTR